MGLSNPKLYLLSWETAWPQTSGFPQFPKQNETVAYCTNIIRERSVLYRIRIFL